MMCSPYLTGSLGLMLLLVTFNYWSVSTNNFDLTKEVTVMQSQLKAGSATIDEQGKDLKDHKSELKKEQERVENLTEEIKRLESVKEDLKICETAKETLTKDSVDREERAGRAGRKERERAGTVRAGLERQVADLQARLDTQAGLLAAVRAEAAGQKAEAGQKAGARPLEPDHAMAPGHLQTRGQAAGLGPGQLPDVDPKAVSVVKKETGGGPGPLPARPLPRPAGLRPRQGSSSTSPADGLVDNMAGVMPPPRGLEAAPAGNLDRAEDDSQLPENGLGPEGKSDFGDDDQNPDGEMDDEAVDLDKQQFLEERGGGDKDTKDVMMGGDSKVKEDSPAELQDGKG